MTSEDSQLALLIGRMSTGDRAAVKMVYDRLAPKLIGLTLRILGNRQDAEDVVQEVFVTLWRKSADYDPARASPSAWVLTIARNRAIDRLRARAARPAPAGAAPADVADLIADDAPHAQADSAALAADAQRAVVGALATLDPRHAAIIREAYFDGLSYEEIAQHHQLPVGTVKSWVFRGLRRMRAGLDPGAASGEGSVRHGH